MADLLSSIAEDVQSGDDKLVVELVNKHCGEGYLLNKRGSKMAEMTRRERRMAASHEKSADELPFFHIGSHHGSWDSVDGAKINDGDCITLLSRMRPMSKEGYAAAREYGVDIITPDRFRRMRVSGVTESIPKANNINVNMDVDGMNCLEVSVISGQECGGLSYLDMEQTLKSIPTWGVR